MSIPDNYDIWAAHDIEMERRRARRPVCEVCGHHIQDETAYLFRGTWIHKKCMENFEELVEDNLEE